MKYILGLIAIFIVPIASSDGIGWSDEKNSYSLTYGVGIDYSKLPTCGDSMGDKLPIPFGTIVNKSKEFISANYPNASWLFQSVNIVKPTGSPNGSCVFVVKFENTGKNKNNKFYIGMHSNGVIFPPEEYSLIKPFMGLRP